MMHANMWGGNVERGGEWTYCPYCGSDLKNRGGYHQGHWDRRGGPGHGLRSPGMRFPGMTAPGYPYGNRYSRDQRPDSNPAPLKKQDAQKVVQDMLARSGNPNLKVGKVDEKENLFIVEIVTKQGNVLVDRIEVNRQSGLMRSEYR